jgi:signal peptidase I
MSAKKRQPDDEGVAAAPRREGILETFESIVVAFILAFVFRAFILEAYVIPTGSMAATLYGEHTTHTCTDCGYQYAYGQGRGQDNKILSVPPRSMCPNCGWLDDTIPEEYAPPEGGDRILVLKWPFDIGGRLLGPHRWDVTVFKDPADGTTNFIKRLVGCPNEVLEIIDGDIYTAPDDAVDPEAVTLLDRIRMLQYRRVEIQRDEDARGIETHAMAVERAEIAREIEALRERLLPLLDKCLHVERKLPGAARAQRSLWFDVYDHDFLPPPSRGVGWKPLLSSGESGWDTSGRAIRFAGRERGTETIRLVGRPSSDFYAYNINGSNRHVGGVVGDRRLRCVLTPLAGDGRFSMRLTKYWDAFSAVFDVGLGNVTLSRTYDPPDRTARTTEVGRRTLALPLGVPVSVELINVDYRVSVVVNGEEVLATDDDAYAPNLAWLRSRPRHVPGDVGGASWEPRAEFDAERLDLELEHVAVDRDVYYTNAPVDLSPVSQRAPGRGNPFSGSRELGNGGLGGPVPGWGTENNPIHLRDKEYFMCGDNSPQSKDSRMWWEIGPHLEARGSDYQLGTVPEDQLLGRAFFVYWPAGYRVPDRAPFGWVPNVGRMRLIR